MSAATVTLPFTVEVPATSGPGHLKQLATGVKHVLTHRILFADFYLLDTDQRPSLADDYVWVPESRLADFAVPRLVEKLVETIA